MLVILASLFLFSVALAAVSFIGDAFSFLGGVILLPISVVLGVQQYRAAFRGVRSAAKCAAIMLIGIGAILTLPCLTIAWETITSEGKIPWFILLIAMLLTIVAGVGGWLNLCWMRSLTDEPDTFSRPRFSMRELFAAMTAVSVVAALTTALIRTSLPRHAEHVDISVAPYGLPRSATDISYYLGTRGTIAYEFTTDETTFRNWVESGLGSFDSRAANVPLLPIANPETIRRYTAFSPDLTGPDSITVPRGLYYSWSFEDEGVHAVFDSSTNRAYYFSHSH